MKCEKCLEWIDLRTDDHYNADHTLVKCPCCTHWQSARPT